MNEHRSIFRQIVPVFLIILIVVSSITAWVIGSISRAANRETIQQAMRMHIKFVELQLPVGGLEDHIDEIQDMCSRMRDFTDCQVTIMRLNGDVIADSHTEQWKMMNQAWQPEMEAARNGEIGSGLTLRSDPDTGKSKFYLVGKIVQNGVPLGFVRISVPGNENAVRILQAFLAIALVVVVAGFLMGYYVSGRFLPGINSMTRDAVALSQDIQEKWRSPDIRSTELEALSLALSLMVTRFKDRLKVENTQRCQLETMFRSMVDAVFMIDNQECILRCNQAARALCLSGDSDVSGRKILEVVRNTQFHQFIRKTLSRNDPHEEDIIFHNQDDLHYKGTGVAIDDGNGTIIGAMIVLHDITRIRKLERIRKDFVANVSHELKTPITAIRGFVETLLESDMIGSENALRFLQIILKQTNQLHAVIEDLLSLSRLEQESAGGRMDVEHSSLEEILMAAAAACESRAAERSVELRVESDQGEVAANRTLLRQAVFNLIDNAIKYGPEHSDVIIQGQITRQHALIRVIDRGAGIPVEFRERIFERFYRMDKSRSRDLGGSGLGLAIVKHIAHAHGGSVNVQCEQGTGTVFTIEIPLEAGIRAGSRI